MATPTTIDPKQLGQGFPADTNNLTIYTVPAGTTTVVQAIDICNTSSASRLARVFLVPNGGAAGVSNALFYDVAIGGNMTVSWSGPQYLDAGALIVVRTDGANSLAFTVSGQELS
jgi:hypothetical protein